MELNFESIARFEEETDFQISALKDIQNRLSVQRKRLLTLDDAEEDALGLLDIEKELDERIISLMKLRKAAIRIKNLYYESEQTISSFIENENGYEKKEIGVVTQLREDTDFDWKMV